MTCEQIEALLPLYLEQELELVEREAVDRHLQTCGSCAVLISCLKETEEALKDFPEVDVSEGFLEHLYSIPNSKKRFKFNLAFLLRPSLQPVLAAATVLLTVVSLYLFNPDRKLIDKTINHQIHIAYGRVGHLLTKAESFTDSLGGYKDNLLVSLNTISPLDRNKN